MKRARTSLVLVLIAGFCLALLWWRPSIRSTDSSATPSDKLLEEFTIASLASFQLERTGEAPVSIQIAYDAVASVGRKQNEQAEVEPSAKNRTITFTSPSDQEAEVDESKVDQFLSELARAKLLRRVSGTSALGTSIARGQFSFTDGRALNFSVFGESPAPEHSRYIEVSNTKGKAQVMVVAGETAEWLSKSRAFFSSNELFRFVPQELQSMQIATFEKGESRTTRLTQTKELWWHEARSGEGAAKSVLSNRRQVQDLLFALSDLRSEQRPDLGTLKHLPTNQKEAKEAGVGDAAAQLGGALEGTASRVQFWLTFPSSDGKVAGPCRHQRGALAELGVITQTGKRTRRQSACVEASRLRSMIGSAFGPESRVALYRSDEISEFGVEFGADGEYKLVHFARKGTSFVRQGSPSIELDRVAGDRVEEALSRVTEAAATATVTPTADSLGKRFAKLILRNGEAESEVELFGGASGTARKALAHRLADDTWFTLQDDAMSEGVKTLSALAERTF
jgi:Domain of unknown function (DUF4340)